MTLGLVALGAVAEVAAGGGAPQGPDDFGPDGLPFIRAGSLKPLLEGMSLRSLERISIDVAKRHRLRVFPANTIVFAKSGMSATKGHIYRLREPAYVVNHLSALIPTARLDSRYLEFALRAKPPVILIKDAAYPSIRLGDISTFEIPLPPLSDQRRIATILDQAETLRAQRRAAIAQLDSLGQAIFLEMFGDAATNPKGWPRTKLGAIAVDGFQNGLYKHASDYGSGTPILRIDAFYDGSVTKIDALKRVRISESEARTYDLRAGDIVINRVNSIEYLGKSALIPELSEPVVFESNMMRFATDASLALSGYVIACLQDVSIKTQIAVSAKQAVNQASINQKDVSAFQICIPPVKMQDDFIRRITTIAGLKSTHRSALAHLDELFASLQHRAFAGAL